jgi:ribosomal protein S5
VFHIWSMYLEANLSVSRLTQVPWGWRINLILAMTHLGQPQGTVGAGDYNFA